ncbi:MAG: phospholipid-binding protein MlaC [Syntrophobacteraceae bacterium]
MRKSLLNNAQWGGIAFLFCFMVWAPAPSLAATGPMDVIRSGSEEGLTLLKKNCKPGEPLPVQAHRQEILNIVYTYFDFEEMAKRALGRYWKDQTPDKQQAFVKLFEQLIFNTYLDRVSVYTCSNENVLYDDEKIEGNYALVKTRVTGVANYEKAAVSVDYRLFSKNGNWRVYDVVLEGVSLVNNYRSQFDSMLTRGSFDDMMAQLRQKLDSPRQSEAAN